MKNEIPRFEVTVSREIAATPAEVYAVWLDAQSPGGPWFGAKRTILDAKVDGLFYHAVHHEGREWAHYGRFIRLEKGKLIEHTWMSEATRGIETTITITLEKRGDGTLFTLRHKDIPDDEMGRGHREGWEFCAMAIAQRFQTRAA